MRAFGGDLGILGLANLLQVVSMSQAKGFLTISNADLKKTIQFCSTGIRLVSGVRRAIPLGQILVRSGRLTNEQLEQLLAEQRSTSRRLGDLVIEKGLVTREAIDQALRDQVSEEIYELFAWPEARFYFAESDNDALPNGCGPLATVLLDANILSLMVEAARRTDEIARFRSEIPVDQLIPTRQEGEVPFDDLGVSRQAATELLPLIDGKRSIEQIVAETSLPKFTVLHTLYELKQRGLLTMETREAADTKMRRKSGPSVLLIGKQPEFRTETAAQLEGGGYSVVQADAWSGAESWLDAVAASILDISVEQDEMLSVCDRIREASRKPFMVLYDAGQGMDVALQSGARYVLVKPVPEKLLLERLASLR
jgi:CheY-like chemotaxis protein